MSQLVTVRDTATAPSWPGVKHPCPAARLLLLLSDAPTSGVDDEAAGVAAYEEAPALHAKPCNLALLQHVLEAAKVLNAPDKGCVMAVCCG